MSGSEAVSVVAAAFDRALRRAGVDAGIGRAQAFARVLLALPPATRSALYWRARAAMLPRIEDLEGFERAFSAVFGSGEPATLPEIAARVERETLRIQRDSIAPEPSEQPAGPLTASDAPIRWVAASLDERLAERSFDAFGPDEQAAMSALIARVRAAGEYRPSRRRQAHRRGDRLDLRRSLGRAPRTAGELVDLRRTRARGRLRPLVFLLDVSGSMEPFARALLQYARVVATARPAVRAFTFATRLTDVSALLRRARAAELLAAVGARVRDYGGGTRIGAALRSFNDRYAQRGVARGGTVVILSDGWERDDPALLRSEMERLRRLARRIVWINPQQRHPAYEPLTRGMAAALPFVDDFLSGHNVRRLEEVAAAVEGAVQSRSTRPSVGRPARTSV